MRLLHFVVVRPLPWWHHLPSQSELDVPDLRVPGSLPAAWARRWGSDPTARVLTDAGDPDRGWCSAAQLEDLTRRLAGRLAALGLHRGDRLLWSTGPSVASVAVNVAALRSGIVVVPANPGYSERELAHIVDDVRPGAAVVDDPGRGLLLARLADGRFPVADCVLETAAGGRAVAPESRQSVVGGRDELRLDEVAPQDPALIAYTSGTTGAPKGAVLSHANLFANSTAVALTWRWGPEDRLIHALPIFHGHGLCVGLYTSLLVGGSVELLPRFEPGAVIEACARPGATLFFGVPTMYHRLLGTSDVAHLGSLRLAVSGSAPLRAELHRDFSRSTGLDVLERYGMTETLMTLSNPYDGERRPGTVGFPFPGVEAVVDDEAAGEILVKGPAVFAGYWERPAATEAAFAGGWFRTGDLAVVEDGYVRIFGRGTDLIISGGYNVYPAEVEDVLLGYPGVAEVAVTGTPSDEWGETVTAWVVGDGVSPVDLDGLKAFAAGLLAPYKRPRLVRVVDGLPRNSMGKVQRSQLH